MSAPASTPTPSWWHVTDDTPVRFRFECDAFKGHPAKAWECRLAEQKCGSAWCSTRVRITPFCAHHLRKLLDLAIRPSTVEAAGYGLFVHAAYPRPVVFKKGEAICEYAGELLTKGQLDDRYGDFTAPYAADVGSAGDAIDAACVRSVGAMANHASGRRANAAITDGGDGTLVLIALRDIEDGKEVFVDYVGKRPDGVAYSFEEPGSQYDTAPVAAPAKRRRFAGDDVDDDDDVKILFHQPPGGNGAGNPAVVPGGKRRRRGGKSRSRRRGGTRSKSTSKSRR